MTEQKLAFERGLIRQMEADLAAKDEVRDLPLSSSLKIFQAFFACNSYIWELMPSSSHVRLIVAVIAREVPRGRNGEAAWRSKRQQGQDDKQRQWQ